MTSAAKPAAGEAEASVTSPGLKLTTTMPPPVRMVRDDTAGWVAAGALVVVDDPGDEVTVLTVSAVVDVVSVVDVVDATVDVVVVEESTDSGSGAAT